MCRAVPTLPSLLCCNFVPFLWRCVKCMPLVVRCPPRLFGILFRLHRIVKRRFVHRTASWDPVGIVSCLCIWCRSALGIVSFGTLLGGTVLGEVLFGPLDPVSGLRILVRIVCSMTVRIGLIWVFLVCPGLVYLGTIESLLRVYSIFPVSMWPPRNRQCLGRCSPFEV